MNPSEELNLLMVQKIMNWERFDYDEIEFRPSEDLNDAFLVVEKLGHLRFCLIKESDKYERKYKAYFCESDVCWPVSYSSKSAAHAICLAALKTLDPAPKFSLDEKES